MDDKGVRPCPVFTCWKRALFSNNSALLLSDGNRHSQWSHLSNQGGKKSLLEFDDVQHRQRWTLEAFSHYRKGKVCLARRKIGVKHRLDVRAQDSEMSQLVCYHYTCGVKMDLSVELLKINTHPLCDAADAQWFFLIQVKDTTSGPPVQLLQIWDVFR